MIRRLWGPAWNQDGQALIEAALVLPILALVTFGAVVFGIMVNTKLSVSGAAREAARNYAIQKNAAQARNVARDYLKGSLMTGSGNLNCRVYEGSMGNRLPPDGCAVEIDPDGGTGYVTVRVTYRQPTFVGGLLGMADEVPLSAAVVFRMEE